MRRRAFLKSALAGLLGASTATAAGARAPRVIVVGGGPAGLAAALHLAEKGVLVTVMEAAGQVGGKAKGWTETLAGAAVDVENGLQPLSGELRHLRALLERYALDDALSPGGSVGLHTGEGSVPREALADLARARSEQAGQRWAVVRRGGRRLARLGRSSLRARFGGRDGEPLPSTPAAPWRRTLARFQLWREPEEVDQGTLAELERDAAGELRWLRGSAQALVWEPLATAIRSQRGKIRLHHRVQSLVVEDGRVVGVTVGEPLRTWDLPVPTGASWSVVEGDEPLFVRAGPNGVEAIHGRCTHAGCSVGLEDGGFACPCHGGRYDSEGLNVSGPPPRPLERARVEPLDQGIRVGLGGDLEVVRADAVVLAVDARSFARLAGAVLPDLRVPPTTGHVVARFWFDQAPPPDTLAAQVVEQGTHITGLAWVHLLQDAAAAWAAQTGGSVLEVRIRALPPAMTRRAVLDLVETEVRLLQPALLEAGILKRTLARGDDFSWLQPGWEAEATPVRTGMPGLFAAGDHVHSQSRTQLLERALATGREAASAILEAFGAEPLPSPGAR